MIKLTRYKMKKMPPTKSSKTCTPENCPGAKTEQEMSGVKQLDAATNLKIDGVEYDQRVAGECLVSAGEHTIGPVSYTYDTPYISGLRTP